MKTIDINSAADLIDGAVDSWCISLADWRFQSEWDGDIFNDIVIGKIFEIDRIVDNDDVDGASLGFFEIPEGVERGRLLTLLGHQATRLFVRADADFFEKIPMNLARAISAPYNQLSERDIREFSSVVGYRSMLIRDGDEGDYFYYFFSCDA